jgi:FKBP-type peptidyl-prolyl cis-trans isomerase 2
MPQAGDVVQVHYSCYLADNSRLLESSRSNRGRPFEFALGLGQVRARYCTPCTS